MQNFNNNINNNNNGIVTFVNGVETTQNNAPLYVRAYHREDNSSDEDMEGPGARLTAQETLVDTDYFFETDPEHNGINNVANHTIVQIALDTTQLMGSVVGA